MTTVSSIFYINRETFVNVSINILLTPLFFWIFFGQFDHVPVWGIGNWLFDFVPQSFIIAFMSMLIPSVVAVRAVGAGKVRPDNIVQNPIRLLILRGILAGAASAALGTGLVAAVIIAAGYNHLGFTWALIIKQIYAGLLAYIITPLGLRLVLGCR